MFSMYNKIGAFNWNVFSWSFFPTMKTKAINVFGFLPRLHETKVMD